MEPNQAEQVRIKILFPIGTCARFPSGPVLDLIRPLSPAWSQLRGTLGAVFDDDSPPSGSQRVSENTPLAGMFSDLLLRDSVPLSTSDPDYVTYYYANRTLNPRLPPPTTSQNITRPLQWNGANASIPYCREEDVRDVPFYSDPHSACSFHRDCGKLFITFIFIRSVSQQNLPSARSCSVACGWVDLWMPVFIKPRCPMLIMIHAGVGPISPKQPANCIRSSAIWLDWGEWSSGAWCSSALILTSQRQRSWELLLQSLRGGFNSSIQWGGPFWGWLCLSNSIAPEWLSRGISPAWNGVWFCPRPG